MLRKDGESFNLNQLWVVQGRRISAREFFNKIGTGLTLAVLPHCWDEQTFPRRQ